MKPKHQPKYNDNMDWLCNRFVLMLKKDFRGHKKEISAKLFVYRAKKFALFYGVKDTELLHALIIRHWFEPSAADTYLIHFDELMK